MTRSRIVPFLGGALLWMSLGAGAFAEPAAPADTAPRLETLARGVRERLVHRLGMKTKAEKAVQKANEARIRAALDPFREIIMTNLVRAQASYNGPAMDDSTINEGSLFAGEEAYGYSLRMKPFRKRDGTPSNLCKDALVNLTVTNSKTSRRISFVSLDKNFILADDQPGRAIDGSVPLREYWSVLDRLMEAIDSRICIPIPGA